MNTAASLPRGIVPVLQTPFTEGGAIDYESVARLVEDALGAGAAGFLVPAVASEVEYLSAGERRALVKFVAEATRRRAPVIAGASAANPEACRSLAIEAAAHGADAFLIAVPAALYAVPHHIPEFFRAATRGVPLPLVVQDLEWNGPGLSLDALRGIADAAPTLAGVKIETVPAGPKYSAVRAAFGGRLHISGGWAVPQLIEALDRGVDAMIPEASMVRVYTAIMKLHAEGRRPEAVALFRRLLPILAFTNQEIRLSIAFFKALLVRRGVFRTDAMRWPGFAWDEWNRRIADELLDLYGELDPFH